MIIRLTFPNGSILESAPGEMTPDFSLTAVNLASCMDVLRTVGYNGVYALELSHLEPFDEGVRQAIKVMESL